MICDVCVALCQPFVKLIHDDDLQSTHQ